MTFVLTIPGVEPFTGFLEGFGMDFVEPIIGAAATFAAETSVCWILMKFFGIEDEGIGARRRISRP